MAGQYGVGALVVKMGIHFLEMSPERTVATMPVEGNTQVAGILHGGAHVVLAETLGSFAAGMHAGPERQALGIDVSATHHRAITSGHRDRHVHGHPSGPHAHHTRGGYDGRAGPPAVHRAHHQPDPRHRRVGGPAARGARPGCSRTGSAAPLCPGPWCVRRPTRSGAVGPGNGSTALPLPSTTGMIEMMISSSAPASANWAARTPPPTIQTFRSPAPALRSSTNSPTGPRTKVTSAPLGTRVFVVGEHPARGVRIRPVVRFVFPQPGVGVPAHHDAADIRHEGVVAFLAAVETVELEQPVQVVVGRWR